MRRAHRALRHRVEDTHELSPRRIRRERPTSVQRTIYGIILLLESPRTERFRRGLCMPAAADPGSYLARTRLAPRGPVRQSDDVCEARREAARLYLPLPLPYSSDGFG